MDQIFNLLDFEGKKQFKKNVEEEEIKIEIYLEKFIKWLGLFTLSLAIIAQLINELSGTDMKCFPEKKMFSADKADASGGWMKDQMTLSKSWGEYADTYCATQMINYGPLFGPLNVSYTRKDVADLAAHPPVLVLPLKRCIEDELNVEQCKCEETVSKTTGKKGTRPECRKTWNVVKNPKPKAKSTAKTTTKNKVTAAKLLSENKHKEKMFHHYFAWALLMQALALLLPQLLWNSIFSEQILDLMLLIYESAMNGIEKSSKDLLRQLEYLQKPYMSIVFFVKQVYYVFGGVFVFFSFMESIGKGIEENAVTRCLIEEYTFAICSSPANGALYFIYLINLFVILLVMFSAIINLGLRIFHRVKKTHEGKDFLNNLFKKMTSNANGKDLAAKLQTVTSYLDFPFFSRLCQENRTIFGDLFYSVEYRDEIKTYEDNDEELYMNVKRLTTVPEE